jgi:non-homologous end joining protein Ku
MIDEKIKGREINVAPPTRPRGQVVDIYAGLERSLATSTPGKASESRGRKKA